MGVPESGICINNNATVEYCSIPTGSGSPMIATTNCPAGTACAISGNGSAVCQATGVCLPGATQCLNSSTLQTCDNTGNWQNSNCPSGCSSGAGGAFCATAGTGTATGSLTYEFRPHNSAFTDWDTIQSAIAANFLVISQSNGTIIDAQLTDANGNYTVKIPASPGSTDYVIFAAIGFDTAGNIAYMVADPGFTAAGTQSISTAPPAPRAWTWSVLASDASQALGIPEASGSGAARIFDYVRYVYERSAGLYNGQGGLSVVAWLNLGTDWDCGSCFGPWSVTTSGTTFQSQVFFGGNLTDQSYWADAVTAHELGHWLMASYGLSPNEGGPHCVSVPTFPGQAWSEGWATFHSSDARGDQFYYDKQQGSMFYIDIGNRAYSSGTGAWQRPTASGGLLQLMDENEVSAMLWQIHNGSTPSIYAALASPRMTTRISQSPPLRGYTRHTWAVSNCTITGSSDTGTPAPCVADMLDALLCTGLSTSACDAATNPSVNYPFPSNAPKCQ